MISRRRFITGSVIALTPLDATASAQEYKAQQGRTYRVGVLVVGYPEELRQALRTLGYVVGQNLAFEVRETEGKPNRVEDAAVELVGLKVDVIVATYPGAVFSAKRASATVPIVMVNTPDPVDLGLVASLAHPGGSITGVTSLSSDLSAKQLELLKQAVPNASRIAVVLNPDNPWHAFALKGLRSREQSLRAQLQVVALRGPGEFDDAFHVMATNHTQALLILADPMTFAHRQRLAELAIKHRLPAMGSLTEYSEAGSLMSYWANRTDLYRRAATYVDRILKGANPADLPIEQPTKFELVINLKTAKTLGLTVPPSLLLRADQVIE